MADEAGNPRLGRKALLFFAIGVVVGIFFPLLGFLVVVFLALAWLVLIAIWVLTGFSTRRPVVYILAFTIGFVFALWAIAAIGIALFA